MEHDKEPLSPTQAVAKRVREVREGRRMTAAQLAAEMTRIGIPWKRGVVAKLENGLREAVSVEELLALAAVLDVAPVHLLVPTEEVPYRVTPTTTVGSGQAREWTRGLAGLPGTDLRGFYAEVPAHELAGNPPAGPGPRLDFEKAVHYWLQRVIGPGGMRRARRDGPIEWIYDRQASLQEQEEDQEDDQADG